MELTHRQRLDAFWANRLGFDVARLAQPGTLIVARSGSPFGRIDIFRRGRASIVLVHDNLVEFVQRAIDELGHPEGLACADLIDAFDGRQVSVVSPTEILWLSPSEFRPAEHGKTRQLTELDGEQFDRFRRSCESEDRMTVDLSLSDPFVAGAFDAGELVACASLDLQDDRVAEIGVLTRSGYRRRGFARQVVSAVCRWGIAQELVLQYSVIRPNLASRNLAMSLRFESYAVEETAYVTLLPFG